MIPDPKPKPKIVIDASFWINIVYLRLEKYLIKYFEVYFVSRVEEEILNDNENKMYDSIDMETYSVLKDQKIIIVTNPKVVPKKLLDNLQNNSGELYSVALAIEEDMKICLDDGNPYNFCFKEKLFPVNSIDFIHFLYLKKEINSKQAIEYVDKLQSKIKLTYIEEGKKLFY